MSGINNTQLSQITGLLGGLNSAGSTINSFDISSLTSIFGTSNFNTIISQLTGSTSIGAILSGGYQAYEGLSSDDTDSQVQGLFAALSCAKNIATKLSSLIAPNEAATAAKDVAENEQKHQAAEAELGKLKTTGNKDIDKYIEAAQAELDNVNKKTAELDKVNADIEAKKQELEKEKEIINSQVAIIKNPSTDNDTRGKAIDAIKASTGNILALAGQVTGMLTTVNDVGAAVATASTNIATNMEGAQNTLIQQLNDMQQLTVEKTADGATTTVKFATEGAANTSTGVILQTAAAAETATIVGAPAAAQTEASAIDQLTAGSTRLGAVGTNMTLLGSFLGTAGQEMSEVASYATTIGEATQQSITAIGSATAKLTGTLTSIGSWGTVVADAKTVETAISAYEEPQTKVQASDNTDNNGGNENKNTNIFNLDATSLFKLEVAETVKE